MRKAVSEEQRNRLRRLAAAPDADIDTSDIPEVMDWSGAVRGGLSRAGAEAAMVRLDADLLVWFRDHAGAEEYQAEINRILRRHMTAEQGRGRS